MSRFSAHFFRGLFAFILVLSFYHKAIAAESPAALPRYDRDEFIKAENECTETEAEGGLTPFDKALKIYTSWETIRFFLSPHLQMSSVPVHLTLKYADVLSPSEIVKSGYGVGPLVRLFFAESDMRPDDLSRYLDRIPRTLFSGILALKTQFEHIAPLRAINDRIRETGVVKKWPLVKADGSIDRDQESFLFFRNTNEGGRPMHVSNGGPLFFRNRTIEENLKTISSILPLLVESANTLVTRITADQEMGGNRWKFGQLNGKTQATEALRKQSGRAPTQVNPFETIVSLTNACQHEWTKIAKIIGEESRDGESTIKIHPSLLQAYLLWESLSLSRYQLVRIFEIQDTYILKLSDRPESLESLLEIGRTFESIDSALVPLAAETRHLLGLDFNFSLSRFREDLARFQDRLDHFAAEKAEKRRLALQKKRIQKKGRQKQEANDAVEDAAVESKGFSDTTHEEFDTAEFFLMAEASNTNQIPVSGSNSMSSQGTSSILASPVPVSSDEKRGHSVRIRSENKMAVVKPRYQRSTPLPFDGSGELVLDVDGRRGLFSELDSNSGNRMLYRQIFGYEPNDRILERRHIESLRMSIEGFLQRLKVKDAEIARFTESVNARCDHEPHRHGKAFPKHGYLDHARGAFIECGIYPPDYKPSGKVDDSAFANLQKKIDRLLRNQTARLR